MVRRESHWEASPSYPHLFICLGRVFCPYIFTVLASSPNNFCIPSRVHSLADTGALLISIRNSRRFKDGRTTCSSTSRTARYHKACIAFKRKNARVQTGTLKKSAKRTHKNDNATQKKVSFFRPVSLRMMCSTNAYE